MKTVQFNNKTLTLQQDAYRTNIVGADYDYEAFATDNDGNEYRVEWVATNLDCDDDSQACDWDKYTVTPL